MADPGEPVFDAAPEADVAEQHTPVAATDEDADLDATRVVISRDADANEADLIEQAIPVPLSDDDADFDR